MDCSVKEYSRGPFEARVIMSKTDPKRIGKLQECWETLKVMKVKVIHFIFCPGPELCMQKLLHMIGSHLFIFISIALGD